MKLLESAVLRLTAWYMLIISVLCLLFSFIVYSIGNTELHRPGKPLQQVYQEDTENNTSPNGPGSAFWKLLEQERSARAEAASHRLLANLIIFDAAALAAGGLVGYLLARRTLRPVDEAMQSQARFSSDAAHELRTPLSVMQSEIEVALRSKKVDKASLQEILASNLDEVHRLRALTDRLLLLANQHDLALSPTKLDAVATDAINNAITLAQSKKISIDSQVSNIQANANHDSLVDVITILLDNAIKYSPSKSSVVLRSIVKGRHVQLLVSDDGPGIQKEDIAHIFDRFYRGDTSRTKAAVEGHGLGLSIARRIMQAHGGTLQVTSKEGQGTTFTMTLQKSS